MAEENLWDNIKNFFSEEEGQKRRQWLERQGDKAEKFIPPHLRPAAEFVAEANPVQGMMGAMQAGDVVFDPEATAEARKKAAVDMGLEMAMAVAPAALVRMGYLSAPAGFAETFGSGALSDTADNALAKKLSQQEEDPWTHVGTPEFAKESDFDPEVYESDIISDTQLKGDQALAASEDNISGISAENMALIKASNEEYEAAAKQLSPELQAEVDALKKQGFDDDQLDIYVKFKNDVAAAKKQEEGLTQENISDEELEMMSDFTGMSKEDFFNSLPATGEVKRKEVFELTPDVAAKFSTTPGFDLDMATFELQQIYQTPDKLAQSMEGAKSALEIYGENSKYAQSLVAGAKAGVELSKAFTPDEILTLASQVPHPKSPEYGRGLDRLAATLEDRGIVNVDGAIDHFKSISEDAFGKELRDSDTNEWITENPIWERMRPIGEHNAPIPNQEAAERLGFTEDVFHYTTSPDEFTRFDMNRDRVGGSKQDRMGVHVGTSRAAVDRNLDVRHENNKVMDSGHTMRLRARTDSPMDYEMARHTLGDSQNMNYSSEFEETGIATERDLNTMFQAFEDQMMRFPDEYRAMIDDAGGDEVVAFRRYLADQGFTHIPYRNDIEDRDNISYIMLTDRPNKETTAVLRDWSAEFDPNKRYEDDLRFAEGGAVMLKTDGMDRDPISGNDIPVGSTAKEVRDDVDAKLSEGEYVLPADVVRYFGLEKVEEMVNLAKEGLAEMDAKGRIGGDPVDDMEAALDVELDDAAMEEGAMAHFAEGGMVTPNTPDIGALLDSAKARAARDPEFAQILQSKGISIRATDAPQTPPSNNMGAPVAMAEGGMVESPFGEKPYDPADYQSGFNPYAHTPGFMGTAATGAGLPGSAPAPTEPVMDKSKMCGPGTVWDEEKQMCVPEAVQNDDDGPSAPTHDPEAWMEKYDYSDPDVLMNQTLTTLGAGGEKEEEAGAKGMLGKLGGFLGDALGGGMLGQFGNIIKHQKYAEAMANAEVLRSHGKVDQADAIVKAANQYAEDNELKLGGFFDSTKTVTKTAMNRFGKPFGVTSAPTPKTTGLGSKPTSTSEKDKGPKVIPGSAAAKTPSGKNEDYGSVSKSLGEKASKSKSSKELGAFQKAKSYVDKAEKEGKSLQEVASKAAPSSAKKKEKTAGSQAMGSGWGGMNRGGLVSRPNKYKK